MTCDMHMHTCTCHMHMHMLIHKMHVLRMPTKNRLSLAPHPQGLSVHDQVKMLTNGFYSQQPVRHSGQPELDSNLQPKQPLTIQPQPLSNSFYPPLRRGNLSRRRRTGSWFATTVSPSVFTHDALAFPPSPLGIQPCKDGSAYVSVLVGTKWGARYARAPYRVLLDPLSPLRNSSLAVHCLSRCAPATPSSYPLHPYPQPLPRPLSNT